MNIIVAMTRDRVIGKDNKLLWHLPEDLKNFKKLTLGNTVVMGRKTFESIGKALPNRHNIVVSKSLKPTKGIDVCPTLERGIARAQAYGKEVFMIGGAQIYRQALPVIHRMYVSYVKGNFKGDVFFPAFNESEWAIAEEKSFPEFEYVVYEREKRPHGQDVLDLV